MLLLPGEPRLSQEHRNDRTHPATRRPPAKGAELTGLSRTKFYEILGKEIPLRKVGRRSLVLVADIERWLSSLPEATK